MKAYELMLLLNPDLDEETREGTLERIQSLIASGGGSVDKVDPWGKRRLAFEVDGLTDGEYVVVDFQTTPDSIAEIDRVLRITDPVARHMLVRREDRDQ